MTQTGTPSGTTHLLAAGVPDRGIGLAFGPVRTVGGVELVPVAFVTYGFGALDESGRFGAGGGGGGVAIPLGAYGVREGALQFRPNTVALLSLVIPIVGALGLAVAKIIRAAKQGR
jgi:hypothetical protein